MIPIKSAREVEKMRKSCRTASDILDRVGDLIRPGISTKEIDEAAADLMEEAGVKSAFLGYRLPPAVFPWEHLYFIKRRGGARHRQSTPRSIRRHREARHWRDSRWLGGGHGQNGGG